MSVKYSYIDSVFFVKNVYVCYAQRQKTLNERKKRPQRVLTLEKQPQREMSCFGCFKTTTTRSFVQMNCL